MEREAVGSHSVTITALVIVFVVTMVSALALAINLGNRNEIHKAVAATTPQQGAQETCDK